MPVVITIGPSAVSSVHGEAARREEGRREKKANVQLVFLLYSQQIFTGEDLFSTQGIPCRFYRVSRTFNMDSCLQGIPVYRVFLFTGYSCLQGIPIYRVSL